MKLRDFLIGFVWIAVWSLPITTHQAMAAPSSNTSDTETSKIQGRLFEETMELENGDTLTYDRGVIQVPVRRAGGSDAKLSLEFYRLRRQAQAGDDTPPIFQLRGGPGFGGLGRLLARPGYYENLLQRYTKIADLIVVGQRGFGTSNGTPCEPAAALTAQQAMDDEILDKTWQDARVKCRKHWQDQGLDLSGFTVLEAADDVIDVADFLGYGKIQLLGGSFGSHWGMNVVDRHPQRIARATFSGLEGPDHTYDMPSGVLGAMARIAQTAEADKILKLPAEGLLAAYSKVIEQLDAKPVPITLELDPEKVEGIDSAQTLNLQLTGDHLRSMLAGSRRYTGFRMRTAQWPSILLSIINGQYEEGILRLVESRLDADLPDASFYMLDCGSGISRVRGQQLRNDPAADMIGPIWLGYDKSCRAWDADLGDDFRQPFHTTVPTVLVQGNWDTSTPYENAVEARGFFANHRFVHVEEGSHGALREALEDVPGFEDSLLRWMTSGQFDHLPEVVELPPVAWQQTQTAD